MRAPASPSISPRRRRTWCWSSATSSAPGRRRRPPAASARSSPTSSTSGSPSAASSAFDDFARRPGWEIDLHEVGYLFLLTREARSRRSSATSRSRTSSASRRDRLAGGGAASCAPCSRSTTCSPPASRPRTATRRPTPSCMGYATAARASSARSLLTGHEVEAIERRDGSITRGPRRREDRGPDTVICAAGAWSRRCGDGRGRAPGHPAAPPDPLHRADATACPAPADDDRLQQHLLLPPRRARPADRDVGPDGAPGFNLETTDDWIPALLEAVEQRAPRVAAAGISGGWAGLYEMSPDHNALIGEAGERLALPLRHRLLRPRLPAGPGDGEILRDLVLRRAPVRRRRAAERRPLRRPRPATRAQHRLMPAPSNVDVAADALREAIVRGRFKPGERIKEIPLAAELDILRGPIRDALRLLERDGLVEEIPNRGAIVPAVRAVDVLEVYALRAALGSLALHKLMLEARSRCDALERALARLRKAVDNGRAKTGRRRRPRLPVADHRSSGSAPRRRRVRAADVAGARLHRRARPDPRGQAPAHPGRDGGAARRDRSPAPARPRSCGAKSSSAGSALLVERLPEPFDERLWTALVSARAATP